MKANANELGYYEMLEILGKTVLFTSERINRDSIASGLYAYDLRHDDDCNGIICEIAPFVQVNHWGTIICREEIELTDCGRRYVTENDYNYTGRTLTIEEYIAETATDLIDRNLLLKEMYQGKNKPTIYDRADAADWYETCVKNFPSIKKNKTEKRSIRAESKTYAVMNINEAIQLTRGCAELLEFDPMTGETTPPHRLEYEQAQAIRMVLAELETTKEKQRWIPCSERTPEEVDGESMAVLAIVKLTDLTGKVYSENYQIVWREDGEWACRGKVTHWMPLPEPPEKKEDTQYDA